MSTYKMSGYVKARNFAANDEPFLTMLLELHGKACAVIAAVDAIEMTKRGDVVKVKRADREASDLLKLIERMVPKGVKHGLDI